MRKYKGIDAGRVLFACFIPLLHIGFENSIGIDLFRQYFSRLGVPFFFSVSGMFLSKSIESNGGINAFKKYAKRIGRMLLIWIVIYSPIIVRPNIVSIQNLIFQTPAFLWYLTGLLVASVPFCLIKNRRVLYGLALILYLFGTLFGDTYRWLLGGMPCYEEVFLTTRNGVFFGLPLMCIGEMTWKRDKASVLMLVISGILLAAEITFIGLHANPTDDRSMYIMLPVFAFYLLLLFREWNPGIANNDLGRISSAIYLMQFGIITIAGIAAEHLNIHSAWVNWGVYLLILIVPTVFYMLIKKTKLVKILF